MTNEQTGPTAEQQRMTSQSDCPTVCDQQSSGQPALQEEEPDRHDSVLEHEDGEDLGLPEIVKERLKLQRSLFEEKQRMYMFEKNYLQSAALYCHGNILAGGTLCA